ncbi:galactose oxidase [Rhizophagus irregularis]|uniref:Galactose oxidase n=1 Tax=Rhizophagus irregularis TaxID=588596 RepID=A0A2I1HM30_9GLOM|nr:galactose oxidase [Rhizophagus irregularis]
MGCKNLKHHLMLILLIQLFLWVTFVNGQFIPGPRSGHTATLIGDKIYFIGGYNFSIVPKESDVFYYDGNKLAWVEVNSQVSGQDADIPPKHGHTANIGGPKPKQDLIFIIGATLVDEIIYYIGGIQVNNSIISYPSMSDIYRYSTVSNTWSSDVVTLAQGNTPGPRAGHSAVLVEGKICIFGGSFNNSSPTEPIAMLDTSTLGWSIPPFKNPRRPNMPNLVYHTATLVDKRMLVAFGNDTDIVVNGGYKGLNNNFYIFDFNNNEWYITTADELTNPSSNIPKLFSSSTSAEISSNRSAIISSSVLGVLVLIVGILIFVCYKRKKNQSKGDVSYAADDSNISYDKFSFSQRSTLYSSQPSMQSSRKSRSRRFYFNNSIKWRFSNRSSNYHTRSETNSHSQRSEAQTQHDMFIPR